MVTNFAKYKTGNMKFAIKTLLFFKPTIVFVVFIILPLEMAYNIINTLNAMETK